MNTTDHVWNIADDIEDLPYLQSLATTLAQLHSKMEVLESQYAEARDAAGKADGGEFGQIFSRLADERQKRCRRLRALTALVYDELQTACEWEAKGLDPADDESLAAFAAEIWELATKAD